jgi:hypothetical protein
VLALRGFFIPVLSALPRLFLRRAMQMPVGAVEHRVGR